MFRSPMAGAWGGRFTKKRRACGLGLPPVQAFDNTNFSLGTVSWLGVVVGGLG